MKKSIIILTLFFALCSSVAAQIPRYVNMEVLGTYNLAGFSFDSRFSKNSKFGYKIGLGYGFEKSIYTYGSSLAFGSESAAFRTSPVGYLRSILLKNVISMPLNASYLFGKSSHYFETGLGVCPYYADFLEYDDGLGYYCFGRLAYRFAPHSKSLSLSIGIDIPFKTPYSDFEQAIGLYPSVSIGYRLN
jgi:hypothetical protein